MSEAFNLQEHLAKARAKALEVRKARKQGGPFGLLEEAHPGVLVALAERIGPEEAASLTPQAAAMRLAALAPRDFLNIQKAARDAAQAADIAERYAPIPLTPEEQAARDKYAADAALASVDYPAYVAQRTKETEERLKNERQ
jgi:hypothetical protein